MGARCLWDPKSDNYAEDSFFNVCHFIIFFPIFCHVLLTLLWLRRAGDHLLRHSGLRGVCVLSLETEMII